jgi:AcrR family transcriptional regulator
MTAVDGEIIEQQAAPPVPARARLIAAGEKLFAEHGWNGVSIRTIAAAADVSLAALNYHFGLKENLLAEIFAARARPIAEERVRLLEQVEASGNATLEAVLDAFLRPALTAGSDSRFGGRVFARLRARLATEPEAFSRRILADAFDDSSKRTIAALQRQLPELPAEELFWRFHFLLGTMVYTMADPGRIQSLSDGKCDPGDVEAALRHIVPFLAAGFRAAPDTVPKRRKTQK